MTWQIFDSRYMSTYKGIQIAPELQSCNDVAIDLVVSVINKVLEKLGQRQSLADIAKLRSYEETGIDLVVSVINKAQEKLGDRKSLFQIANSRNIFGRQAIISLTGLKTPLAITSEHLIKEAIEKVWKLTETFLYHLKYLDGSTDESSRYYYYEAIFSQPTITYPVSQVTASVFFRVEDKLIDHPESKKVPAMVFRIEGHYAQHDVRYVKLIPEWILEVMMMKLRVFKRVERIRLF
ncbi:28 kDa a-kinase anchor domain-containing protein [Phthorimaea operculella]|nr:28 kDa a-kinase anchor domain-containing protein [Phthorimaea operculella]